MAHKTMNLILVICLVLFLQPAFCQFNSIYTSLIDLKELTYKVCITKVSQETEVNVEISIRLESANTENIRLSETWIFPREISDGNGNSFKEVKSYIERRTNENIVMSYTMVQNDEKVKGNWKFKLHHKNKLLLEKEFWVN